MQHSKPFEITPEWLIKHGCAYDAVGLSDAHPNPVEIWIDPNPVQSMIFRIAPGMTGAYITAQITARGAAVFIKAPLLELKDAPGLHFELLAHPVKSSPYEFPWGEFSTPQETVLNHKFPGRLRQGHPWDGFILATALQRLPDKLRGLLAAELTLFDELGKIVGSAELKMAVQREEHGKVLTCTTRESVFAPEYDDEEWSTGAMQPSRTPALTQGTLPHLPATYARPQSKNKTEAHYDVRTGVTGQGELLAK